MSDKFKDTDLREALRRKYANTPQLPADFIDRMRSQQKPAPKRHWRWTAVAAAACLLIIGIGATLMFHSEDPVQSPQAVAYADPVTKETNQDSQQDSVVVNDPRPTQETVTMIRNQELVPEERQPVSKIHVDTPQPVQDLHYAANIIQEDTTAYQDPARMDEFIAKLAEFNKVKALSLDCSSALGDTTIVSTAYVFEDRQRLDLFSRLLQAACWYDTKTPGYLLNFSQQQFFFTLKDLRKDQKHLWIMGRLMDGRILLFSTHSPIEAPASLTCYQAFLEQLTNNDYILSQF